MEAKPENGSGTELETKPENSSVTELLKHLYYNVKGDSTFATAENLHRVAKRYRPDLNISLSFVRDWLSKQVVYTRHRRPRFKFQRMRLLFLRQHETWTSDVIFLDGLENYGNGKFKYIVSTMDCFSRFLWLHKCRTKTKKDVEEALRSAIDQNGGKPPMKLWTDAGGEYHNPSFYQEFQITHYWTSSPIKGSMIENMNRQIENLLFKLMTREGNAKWIDKIDTVAEILNNKRSKKIHGLTPTEAKQKKNEGWLRAQFLEDHRKFKEKIGDAPPKFQVGQTVRVVKPRGKFTRGYDTTFEQALETVERIIPSYPYRYKLTGKKQLRYSAELEPAKQPASTSERQLFIAGKRVIGGKKLRSGAVSGGQNQYLLRAVNDDTSSWISEREYQKLKNGNYLE